MSFSRRAFLSTIPGRAGVLSGAMVTARGREALEAEAGSSLGPIIVPPADSDEIRISSNENPMGPGASAMKSILANLSESNRYPMNAAISDSDFRERLAKKHEVKAKNIVISPGSGEILRNAVRQFTSPDRALVTGECSYENPVGVAEHLGSPVKSIPMTDTIGLDLDKMAGAAIGAGLVFLCNPNNPTGTSSTKREVTEFVKFVKKESPYTAILIDEAYFDYVTDPNYEGSVDLAMKYRDVFVARTFSKAYGMAGLRMGYAVGQSGTVNKLRALKLTFGTTILGIAAAMGSLDDPGYIESEVKRNDEARKYTMDFFANAGYESTDSQTNFIFVNIKRPAKEFREACAKFGVLVGRDFPPYEKTHARISIGTIEEMKKATEIFGQVLGMASTDGAQGN